MSTLTKLHALIANDDGSWFVQGLEIDYAAEAESLDGAKVRFEDGIAATARRHLGVFGHTQNMLQAAPPEVWKRAENWANTIRAARQPVTVTVPEVLPFGPFAYIQEVKLMRASGDLSFASPIVIATLKRHGVVASMDDEFREVLQKGVVLEVHRLPSDVHGNMLDRLARRFGFDPVEFSQEAEDLWNEIKRG
jgi:hypothetical protein